MCRDPHRAKNSCSVQMSIQQNIYENTKEIGRDTKNITVRRLFSGGVGVTWE